MGKIGKSSALILTLIVAMSCLALLTAKPTNAQNNVPSVSILYPTNKTFFNVSIEGVFFQLLYQTNDSLSWAGYSIDGGANVTCTGNTTYNSAYIKDGYQFDFGHPTLTLYANNTAGKWAIPQTVTYTVYFYADTTNPPTTTSPTLVGPTQTNSSNPIISPTPSSTHSPSTTPTASIPEFSPLTILLLLIIITSAGLLIYGKKHNRRDTSFNSITKSQT